MPINRQSLKSTSVVLLILLMVSGCTSLRDTTPAVAVRPNLLDATRSNQEPINFRFLRQNPPPAYLLGPGDVLGVYVEGVLGTTEGAPPLHYSEKSHVPPAVGYPVPVREDGTLALPLVPPIRVDGLTLAQAEDVIRRAYTVDRQILQPGRDRTMVTLMHRRTYRVLVIREDATTKHYREVGAQGMLVGSAKRGETYVVELPAYENDILHALSESGGLPGMDAKNIVTVIRGGYGPGANPNQILAAREALREARLRSARPPIPLETAKKLANLRGEGNEEFSPVHVVSHETEDTFGMVAAEPVATEPSAKSATEGKSDVWIDVETASFAQQPPLPPIPALPPAAQPDGHLLELLPTASGVLRIPLRAAPGEPLPMLNQQDILLYTGDILFIESRDAEVFYTGGVLPGGQFQIPRDYDLDVLGAISMAGGSIAAGVGGGTGRGGIAAGICPPTRITIVRMVNGCPVTIRTSVKQAMKNPCERILIQPNDIVMLEYTPFELMMNIAINNLQFNYFLNNIGK